MKCISTFAIVLSLALLPGPGAAVAAQVAEAALHQGFFNPLVGTWRGVAGDSSASQVVTLELRSDGTYTKTLNATVGGSHYGGTHEGTWRADGMQVHLSGSSDSRWPPYTHDLKKLQKVK